MSNNKQSSVDWLFNKLLLMNPNILGFGDYLEQAKAMHKQQIIDAWAHGVLAKNSDTAEQYYTETYNND